VKKPGSRFIAVANVASSQLNTAIVMAGSFVVTPAVLDGLGDAAYGGWLLINSFIGYLKLLDLGAGSGLIKFGAGAYERDDKEDLRRVLDTAAAIFVGIGMLTMLVTGILTYVLPRLYPAVAADQTLPILMLGGSLAIDLGLRPFAGGLRMRSLHVIYEVIEIGTYSTFKLGLVLWFAHQHELSYRVLALLTLSETAVRMVLVSIASLVATPAMRRINPFGAVRGMMRKIAGMGVAVTIINVADIVRFQMDAAVIGWFMPEHPESISVFGVGTRLASIALQSISVIGGILMPRFSGLSEKGDHDALMKLLRKASTAQGLLSSLVLVNLAVLGPHFLELWLKKPWVPESGKILLLMLPGYYISLLAGPSANLLIGRGALRGFTVLTVVEALANLVLSIVLIRPFGIFGVALGTVVPLAIARGIVFPWLLHKETGIKPSEYWRMHVGAIATGVVYLLVIGAAAWVPLTSYARFIMIGSGTVAVFGAIVMAAFPDIRASVLRRLPGRA
jgi:O-antigen/teichoic acid export membrane protein